MMDELICLQNVDVCLPDGARLLRVDTLRVQAGETVAFLGGSAQAREALMGVIAGMTRVSAGVVRVAGCELNTASTEAAADLRNAHIGYVPGTPQFLDALTVLENAALPLNIRGVARDLREKAAMKLLEETGLRPMAYAQPTRLTRQERLRLALARALVTGPQILMIDDLTAGIMEAERSRLQDVLAKYRDGSRATLQFAQEEAVVPPDRVFHINHGEIREDQ